MAVESFWRSPRSLRRLLPRRLVNRTRWTREPGLTTTRSIGSAACNRAASTWASTTPAQGRSGRSEREGVTMASNHDSGPVSCWGRTCWPGGGIVVYRLLTGPFVGKYVYVAERITVRVKRGQHVQAGQPIATLHNQSPHMETGWASGKGAETLAIARGHQCRCGDPGGWSTIEGRNFNHLLVALGAPPGYLEPNPPRQRMPRRWPRWPRPGRSTGSIPHSATPLSEGFTPGAQSAP